MEDHYYDYYFSMKRMLHSTSPELPTEAFIHNIHTKHKYSLIINHERQSKVLVYTSNFDTCYTFEDAPHVFYIKVKQPIEINNKIKIDTFEVDLDGEDDVLGFLSASDLYFYCKMNNIKVINTSAILPSKLIFSSQLANYLISKGFKMIGVKPHQADSSRSIFVFLVEDGFYAAISDYRQEKNCKR